MNWTVAADAVTLAARNPMMHSLIRQAATMHLLSRKCHVSIGEAVQ